MQNLSDNSHQLDEHLTFANTEVKKGDYVSRHLPYALASGDYSAWDELIGTLYSPEERTKIEWVLGAIVSGDSKKIQKFLVLYGPAGTGKSTILNIVEKLFAGYTTSFEAKALGSSNNMFATEAFRHNPLVAIQHDGDLSKIDDNTKLNSIIAHEDMQINEKFKASYTSRVNAFLLMGTNQPVRISDAKSGIIRRLIDVSPTGKKIPTNHYHTLMSQIDFELGAIAQHCLDVYRDLGKNYYNGYQPLTMMFQTDIFFNFIEAHYDIFKSQDSVSLRQAYTLYKEYCADTGIERPLPQYKIREELRNYFEDFKDRAPVNGVEVRSVYIGFTASKFKSESKKDKTFSIVIEETDSILDREYEDQAAQYANDNGLPRQRWENVKTTLSELDTAQLHYVMVPDNHIVIDFDIKDDNGDKSLEKNLEAASLWPPTYAELSKSGSGVHLHYIYVGDTTELASVYSEGIEIKTLLGNASLRRQLTKCNNVPIATLAGGLPIKEKKMLQATTIQSEKGLRDLIKRNLNKEINPGTKSSVEFILKILDDAYDSGLVYDVSDMQPKIMAFANNSTNQPLVSLKMVQRMKWKSEPLEDEATIDPPTDDRVVIFDVEVYPNLFVVCWKYENDADVVRMINPTAQEVEQLFRLKLVGFYNRRYDNHIIYARYLGYDNEQLFKLSQKIIDGNVGAMFGEAFNLSYADIWDFSSKKQGLKKFQIDLGLHHKEMDLPWDQPVPEDRIADVVDYCVNDVTTTEVVWHERQQDFVARQILAELSGLTVNDTTQKHTARIIFGNDRNPQASFVYTDLSKEFPGYVYDFGKSTYRGEEVGEGGYVYAEPGIYENVALLDVASMHPTTIEVLNLFGEYTPNFAALKAARMAIKHKEYGSAKKMLGGKLAPYLGDPEQADALAYALKIVINIVYGLTSAKFDNAFRDIRNVDNIVAKRGALFMIDLKHAVQERGFTVAHIKTDSIKIPNATPEIIEFVREFGGKYGYDFEHEATYDKFCLVNEAVYIARKGTTWDAVGAQFQHPVVYKTLFTKEPVMFDDMCETKQVQQGAMYLDFELDRPLFMMDNLQFVGRTGLFIPVMAWSGGGILYRIKEGKHYAVSGTKGYLWMEAEKALVNGNIRGDIEIDSVYFEKLIDAAKKTISKFGDFDSFVV
jgi:energy-coupling factor transporter ATP-binding protein EcfA2